MTPDAPISLHVAKGQSNWIGSCSPERSRRPTFPAGVQFAGVPGTRALRDVSQGIIGAGLSSPMYYFLKRWRDLTGEHALSLMTNDGSTGLLKDAGGKGSWQIGVENSLDDTSDANIRLTVEGINLSPRFSLSKIYVHWCQGEQDALMYNGDTVSRARYKAELQKIHDRVLRTASDLNLSFGKFCVYETGRIVNARKPIRWEEICGAQNDFVAANPETSVLLFDKAKESGPLVVDARGDWVSGWSLSDQVHYSLAAWRAMGQAGAQNLHALLGSGPAVDHGRDRPVEARATSES